jgi:UbiD family decarboxylase
MPFQDHRAYLDALDACGKLYRITKPVDRFWEIGALIHLQFQVVPEEQRRGLLFENVIGYDAPVSLGVIGASREVVAIAMSCKTSEIYETWVRAVDHPIPPVEVARSKAPVKDVIVTGDDVDLDLLPMPLFTPGRDLKDYLTATCTITKDRQTGVHNIGQYRFEHTSKDVMGSWFAPGSGMGIHYYNQAQVNKEPLPVCIAIGGDPSLILTSMGKFPYGVSEYDVAGGLRGAPVETVKAETCDLQVPAWAEYVIEGYVPPFERIEEGPFGEYTGFMGTRGPRPYMKVTCITHRKKPILHTMISGVPPMEGATARGQVYGAMLYRMFKHVIKEPGVKDVHFTVGSGAWGHAVVQMKPLYPGHSRKVGLLATSLLEATAPKVVTLVDDDIDPRDPLSVEWAQTFRVNPARDVTIIDRSAAPNLDPSSGIRGDLPFEDRLIGSKMIIDATIKTPYPEISLPSRDFMERAMRSWHEAGLPPISFPERTRLLMEKHGEAGDRMVPFTAAKPDSM